MPFRRHARRALLCVVAAASVACGGDKSGGTEPTRPAPPTPNFITLQSDAEDYIGAGRTYSYSQANAVLHVSANGNHLSVDANGDEWWFGQFQTTAGAAQLMPGTYSSGVNWSGEGRGCGSPSGTFTIDSVTYVAGNLTSIDMRFLQHCDGNAAALHGTIHWRADDTTRAPGPVRPVPTGLWQPPAGSTPATGNYVYLQSDAGDYIGGGVTYTYGPGTPVYANSTADRISISVDSWSGDFRIMNTLQQVEQGYYPGLQRYPFDNPTKGGLNWSGQGRGCNTLTGWYAIDQITFASGVLTSIDLRFEQHCEGGVPALHGAIHWHA
jgi:hypothetical protein